MQFFIPEKNKLTPTQEDFLETSRYLGYKKTNPPEQNSQVALLINECIQEMFAVIKPQSVFEEFDLQLAEKKISFADTQIVSQNLAKNLNGCSQVILFAATIGPQVDILIRRTQIINPAKAAVFQAVGAMFIEKFVDLLNDEIKMQAAQKDRKCKPRFSPGFGDVPLETQKDFFRLLPCTKIGLSLMDTLIMSPEKSVTAFVGII